ncbi:pseudouridine synthase [Aquabacter cavernae]|uniref:pseudouridine synthase n=1 Tax=Aquabacter cavernae TaxID=2496029 RepID=UPI000F8F498F|nr:pseudouridine synthase [Aquabacter cavernae]
MPSKLPPRKDKNRVPRIKREIAPVHKDAERVAKVIARAGLGSRREIEDWIEQGRVAVNGAVLQSPAVTVTAHDRIEVDGAPLPEKERTRLFLYHKPRGVVTTNRDPEGRTTLFEILPRGLPRLVSIGRLDLNSEGLLLLTNDGGLARVLELPETGWLRRYRVRAKGEIDQAKLDSLMKGMTVEGVTYGPIEATLDRVQGANAWITVSLREGKNREVRNVLAALGMIVNRLIRVSYGPFQLGYIEENGIEEVRTRILRDQIGAELEAASGADFDGPLVEHEIEPAPQRPAADAPRPRGPRRAEREPEGRARSRHPEGVEEDVVSFRLRSRKAASEEREVESRGSVADRKGREIQVERVVTRREEAPPAKGRRPGSGDGPRGRRGEGAERGFDERPRGRPSGDRPFKGKGGPRPQRGDYGAGDERPRGRPSGDRPFRDRDGDRPAREDFRRSDERPRGRPSGDRPFRDKGGDRPPREDFRRGDERPRGRPSGDRPFRHNDADRPAREDFRRGDERPRGRPSGDRPFKPRDGDRPAREDFRRGDERPRGRPSGDRPFRHNDADRPAREDFRRGDERPRGRPSGDRPFKPRDGDRPAREDFRRSDDRPRTGPGGKGPGAKGGARSGGPRPSRPRADDDMGFVGGSREDKPWSRDREGGFGGHAPGGRPGGKPAGRPGAGGPKRFGPPKGARPGGKPGGRPGGGKPGGGKPSGPPRKRG